MGRSHSKRKGKSKVAKGKNSDETNSALAGILNDQLLPEEESDGGDNFLFPQVGPLKVSTCNKRSALFDSLSLIVEAMKKCTEYHATVPNLVRWNSSVISDTRDIDRRTFALDQEQMKQVCETVVSTGETACARACCLPPEICLSTYVLGLHCSKQGFAGYDLNAPFQEKMRTDETRAFKEKGELPQRPRGFCVLCDRAYTEAVFRERCGINKASLLRWETVSDSRSPFSSDAYGEHARIPVPDGVSVKPEFVGLHLNLMRVSEKGGVAYIDQSALRAPEVQSFGPRACSLVGLTRT